jgi:hypothetical protein
VQHLQHEQISTNCAEHLMLGIPLLLSYNAFHASIRNKNISAAERQLVQNAPSCSALVRVAFILICHPTRGVNASWVPVPICRVKLIYSVGVRKVERVRLVNRSWIKGVSDLGKIVCNSSGSIARLELLDVFRVPTTQVSQHRHFELTVFVNIKRKRKSAPFV